MSRQLSPFFKKQVVTLIANGHGQKQIADITGYHPDTIQRYLQYIYKEHGAKNSPHLVHIWHTKNLV